MWLPSRSDGAPSGDRRSPTVVDISHRDAKLLAEPLRIGETLDGGRAGLPEHADEPGLVDPILEAHLHADTDEAADERAGHRAIEHGRDETKPASWSRVLRPGSDSC